MNTVRRAASFSPILLSLAACSAAPERELDLRSPPSPPADPWSNEVRERIQDGAWAFLPDDVGYTASISRDGPTGRFDLDGAWLGSEADSLLVRTVGAGRRGAISELDLRPPTLGACVPGRVDPEGACVQRLEYADPLATEWWAADAEGFEQGWTLERSPAGDGALVLEVAVAGATPVVGDGEVWLTTEAGTEWTVAGLDAWDANGTRLESSFEAAQGGFRVVVDDEGAVFPIEVDPVYTTATTTLTGAAVADQFGFSVAGAGDVNRDGYDDVIIGAAGYSSSTGRAYVYLGSSAGLSTSASTTLTGTAGSDFGEAVAAAGDVNGDGYDDVIVGAAGATSSTGYATVYLGSSRGITTSGATSLYGASAGGRFGISVSGAGDVDADGYDDVIVGADEVSASSGRAYVYMGSAAGLSNVATTTLSGASSNNHFGRSVAAAGDVNGDGYDDVIVGAYGYSNFTGRAYVYPGSSAGLSSSAVGTLTGGTYDDMLGYSVAGAGDVDGDGYADVVVGAYGDNSRTGSVGIYSGSATGVSSAATTTLTGDITYAYFGGTVAAAGDTNADGYDDVIVGAPGTSPATERVFLFAGSTAGVASTATSTLTGVVATSYFGSATDGAGDIDGDGYDDVLVGAYNYSSQTGRVYVHMGYADEDGDGVVATIDCDDNDATVGAAGTRYVDHDGDGYGTTSTGVACPTESGYADVATDCDDTVATTNPAAPELCDPANTDEDCDGATDDLDASATGQTTFYVDADIDGYGSATTTGSFCDLPYGYVSDNTDCDDTVATTNPGAPELCDAADTDEDCDGAADDLDTSATGRTTFYVDADIDGYGSATSGSFCDLPSGYVADSTDCDDAVATTNPGAPELCDAANTDEDCDGAADDLDASATGQTTSYVDADADGYGGTTSGSFCDLPSGYALEHTDCDDAVAAIHPGAEETCDAADTDEDCDGAADDLDTAATGRTALYVDADGDGYGSTTSGSFCDPSIGYVADNTDCDDEVATVNPGAAEVCNALDDDCDGRTDIDATDATQWYADADGDTYTVTIDSVTECAAPAGYAAASETQDCDDTIAAIHPGATDVGGDSIDQNCDGLDSATEGCGCVSADGQSAGNAATFGLLLVLALRRRQRGV